MRERLERFMAGRYGVDELSKFMLGCIVVCMILNLFVRTPILNTLVTVGLILIYIRMLSRNIGKRYEENMKFLDLKQRVMGRFNAQKQSAGSTPFRADRKTHRIYKCPGCQQKIRVPKGRGKIAITCPKCRKEFIKKT